jgi:hypothetical protein
MDPGLVTWLEQTARDKHLRISEINPRDIPTQKFRDWMEMCEESCMWNWETMGPILLEVSDKWSMTECNENFGFIEWMESHGYTGQAASRIESLKKKHQGAVEEATHWIAEGNDKNDLWTFMQLKYWGLTTISEVVKTLLTNEIISKDLATRIERSALEFEKRAEKEGVEKVATWLIDNESSLSPSSVSRADNFFNSHAELKGTFLSQWRKKMEKRVAEGAELTDIDENISVV